MCPTKTYSKTICGNDDDDDDDDDGDDDCGDDGAGETLHYSLLPSFHRLRHSPRYTIPSCSNPCNTPIPRVPAIRTANHFQQPIKRAST